MPSFASLGKFFGKTASEGAAFAAGVAVAPALSPVVREIVNEANAKYQTHPVDPGTAAAIVAEDVDQLKWGEQEAAFSGVSPARFDRIVKETLEAPGPSELREMFRRGQMTPAQFEHGLRKAKLETLWDDFEKALIDARLSPEVVAELIQRSLVTAPFKLPYDQVGPGGRIPSFPRANIAPEDEAKAGGVDKERLYAMTALAGNPPGPEALYHAQFRGAIDGTDTQRGLAEGRARQEWGPAYEAVARAIPSVTNYVEARVRGWITPEQMNEGIARHGMTADDGQLEFLIHGRPLSWHQVFIGQRRGGVYDGPTGEIDPPFLKALQESNIRPEWYSIAWAQRYNYPAAFVLRTLTTDGDLTQAQTETILLYEGWEPGLAKTVSTKWAAATTSAKLDPAVKSAQTKFLTAAHKAFVGGAITDAQGVEQLKLAGISADAQLGVLDYWRKEKALEQIKPPPA